MQVIPIEIYSAEMSSDGTLGFPTLLTEVPL